MKLVLAEKPSVAQSIAKVLGAAKREDGYVEGNGYIVSWCVGHLVELAEPEAYDAKYSKWSYNDLPIFPLDWKYEISSGTKKQFGVLKKLMARDDVTSLVCATDAGREGELIFRLVYQKCGCRKPFERLWISSMEDVAIKEGFENLRSETEYDALYEAALCRERADWIVGINATRLFSTLYGQTLNVGRVMTPTLAMAVMREAAIAAFKPEPFYTVQIGLDGFTASSERYKKKAEAEAISKGSSVATVTKAERKEKSEKPPALYDLTSLQRDANRVLGYTAQQTLDYTQNLYEKKLVTYPRTDSRFLTEDMAHSLPELVDMAFHTFPVAGVDNVPVHGEQVVNNKKVTDHHAIMVSRHVQQSTASSISGQSGGIGVSLGSAMYHNSLGKDGGFASKVIGAIATGQTGGSITGDSAVEALNGYFAGSSDAEAMPVPATGENIPTAMATAESDTVLDAPIPATPLALEGNSTIDVSPTRGSEIAMRASGGSAVTEQTTIPTSSSIQQAAMNRVLLGQMGNSVTDVEIGGGKIQGREIIPGRGQIQFAMYNAHQYEKPEGHFTEQTSRDGEKWYKVYATTRVEKTPIVQDERGRMQYDEHKVAAMPKAPARRH